MQIHELNNRRKPTNEATGFGPLDSAINTTKAVFQNPHSLWNSSALATAQQQATQASAASSAAELANPGSQTLSTRKLRGSQPVTVGGSAKPVATPQQQLAIVQSNPAVQQMVKNLAGQWKSQGKSSAAKINTAMTEDAQLSPAQLAKIPVAVQMPYQTPGAGTTPTASIQQQPTGYTGVKTNAPTQYQEPEPKVNALKVRKNAAMRTDFLNWARSKLQTQSVSLDALMKDPWAAKTLDTLLNDIAVESLINPESDQTSTAVEKFFNVVIATNQSLQQQGSQGARQSNIAAPAAAAGDEQADDAAKLKQYGLNMSSSQLDTLASALRRADKQGLGTVRNTGNEALNALVRAAGYKVAET